MEKDMDLHQTLILKMLLFRLLQLWLLRIFSLNLLAQPHLTLVGANLLEIKTQVSHLFKDTTSITTEALEMYSVQRSLQTLILEPHYPASLNQQLISSKFQLIMCKEKGLFHLFSVLLLHLLLVSKVLPSFH
jgi:hypothetical protein